MRSMLAQFKQIIVPVDGSEGAGRAARFANDLGVATGLPVTPLHVFTITPGEVIGVARMEQADIEALRKESARKAFEAAREAVGGSGHTVNERIVFGEPVDEILAYASPANPKTSLLTAHSVVAALGEGFSFPVQLSDLTTSASP
jgi:nucleotide-binding universal stress UspA family protein